MNIELNNKLSLIEAYGNYSFALKAKKDILNLPKVYSQNFIKTFFTKIKLLIDLRFNFSRSNDETLKNRYHLIPAFFTILLICCFVLALQACLQLSGFPELPFL